MADADKCALCGAIIPEGRQVCPTCSKEEPTMRGDYFNSEGYPDPTAYSAMSTIKREENAALDYKVNFLIKVIKFIATEAGFDITNRIELRDRKTGRVFK